ncbi:BQ2448_5097 [Microbotryum intermedium]|uniref:BQ2448_5097 protein n=1 Tax=Microbotryum intermedium TaxID=269621 RepID=A0A238F8V4_9BASI|nr:BQ2448_5097 [Microbotryum intermedium]
MRMGQSSTTAACLGLLSATVSFISVADAAPVPKGKNAVTEQSVVKAKDDVACSALGQFPVAVNGACVSCSSQFPGASACTATAATRWSVAKLHGTCVLARWTRLTSLRFFSLLHHDSSTGFLSAGACVAICPSSTSNVNNVCTACITKFAGAATCTSTAATRCNSGFLTGGQCASVCRTGFVNAASTRPCVPCTKFDNLAVTCSAGKIATCVPGAYVSFSLLPASHSDREAPSDRI